MGRAHVRRHLGMARMDALTPNPSPEGEAGGGEMRIVCRFMTHPRTSCASCMGQGEIVTGRGAREGEVASDGGSSGLTALGRLARLCGIAVSAHAQPKALSKAMSRPTPVQPTDAGGAGRRRKCRRFSPEALEMPPGLTGRAPDADARPWRGRHRGSRARRRNGLRAGPAPERSPVFTGSVPDAGAQPPRVRHRSSPVRRRSGVF
jgi:hypothetical protein